MITRMRLIQRFSAFAHIQLVLGLVVYPAAAWSAAIIVDTALDRADLPVLDLGLPCGSGTIDQLPGSDGLVSLREAIAAANNTQGQHSIRFADSLRGETIRIEVATGSLPVICGDGLDIDGDIDGNGTADVTLEPSELENEAVGLFLNSSGNRVHGMRISQFRWGIAVVHDEGSEHDETSRNDIEGNHLLDGFVGLAVGAGTPGSNRGRVGQTRIVGNRITGASIGILITASSEGSAVRDTLIERNEALNCGTGIQAVIQPETDDARISGLSVRGNTVRVDHPTEESTTLAAFFAIGPGSDRGLIEHLMISGNVFENAGPVAGFGATDGRRNRLTATVDGNVFRGASELSAVGAFGDCETGVNLDQDNVSALEFSGNRFESAHSGIHVVAGSNCARGNSVDVSILGNNVSSNEHAALFVAASFGGTRNSVTAEVNDNRLTSQASATVAIHGALSGLTPQARARENEVRVVGDNNVISAPAGDGLLAVSAIGPGARGNRVHLELVNSDGCTTGAASFRCIGHDPVQESEATGTETGNIVGGSLRSSSIRDTVIAEANVGGACEVEILSPRMCTCAGDCNGDASVTVDEIIAIVAIALGAQPRDTCMAGDRDNNGSITVDEILASVATALTGCGA